MDGSPSAGFYIFAVRIAERVTLSAIVVLIALVVCVGFWRSVQKIDFSLGRDSVSGSASVLLATPVLALAALIGFAWVSFSNPITVSIPVRDAAQVASGDQPAVMAVATGMVPAAATVAIDSDTDRNRVQEQIRHLNCVTSTPGVFRAPLTEESIIQIKLRLMKEVWFDEWGLFADFENSAVGNTLDDPNPSAKAFFDEVHSLCSSGSHNR